MDSNEACLTSGCVFKIQKYSLHDGPGIRTTIFFKGCPLSCWWCHNPESISPAIETVWTRSAEAGPAQPVREELLGWEAAVDELLREVDKDRIFYEESGGGVTLSGGEPLMQPGFALELARACSEMDLHVTLDTSGHGPAEALEELLTRVDLVLFDLKLVDPEMHKRYTGLDNEVILANLARLDAANTPYRIRFPVVPGITDTAQALDGLVGTLTGLHRHPQVDLLPYHTTAEAKYARLGLSYRLQGLAPPSGEQMEAIAARMRRNGLTTTWGNPS